MAGETRVGPRHRLVYDLYNGELVFCNEEILLTCFLFRLAVGDLPYGILVRIETFLNANYSRKKSKPVACISTDAFL